MPVQKWSDRIWVVQLSGDPGFTEDLDDLRSRVPATQPVPDLVLDLSAVEHLNSSNLSHLLRLRKTVIDAGTRMRVAAPNNRVWALFLSTGLDKVFEFNEDTTMALADLQIEK